MLRAVRFAARFGYAIESHTFAAIHRHAPEIHSVSAERIREELSKLLTEGAARRGFELLDKTRPVAATPAGDFRHEGRASSRRNITPKATSGFTPA